MKRDSEFARSLDRLKRWRSKRLAHRQSDYIKDPPPVEDMVRQNDFDRVVARSFDIMDALRVLFPGAGLADVRSAQKVWADNARQFWSGVLKPYPELLSLFQQSRPPN